MTLFTVEFTYRDRLDKPEPYDTAVTQHQVSSTCDLLHLTRSSIIVQSLDLIVQSLIDNKLHWNNL